MTGWVAAGVMLLLVLGTAALWGSQRRRIRQLAADARRIAEWDRSRTLPVADDDLGALCAAFDAVVRDAALQVAELRRRDDRTRELLADLAHDVRTPLASLKLGLGRLPDAAALRAEVEHLDGLFANLSALIQLEASSIPLKLRPLALGPVVERVGVRLGIVAKDRGAELAVSVPDEEVVVELDPLALEQAVGNLVHNAVKFCTAHVAVLLVVEGDEAVVRVLDDGPGVDPAEIPRLAERRFRGAQALDRGRPGQGLGLAIASSIADRHHGAFEIRRGDGGGTVAEIRLPRASAPVARVPQGGAGRS